MAGAIAVRAGVGALDRAEQLALSDACVVEQGCRQVADMHGRIGVDFAGAGVIG